MLYSLFKPPSLKYDKTKKWSVQLTAFSTAWCKENLEVMLTVFTAFKLIENVIREWTETLSTPAIFRINNTYNYKMFQSKYDE